MYKVQTTISFEAAHRLYGVNTYSKECRTSVHGHSYKVTIVVGREDLNDAGMVIDFKLFKKVCKVIEDRYDHSLILRDTDPLVEKFREVAPEQRLNIAHESPTAEWMAKTFYYDVFEGLLETDPLVIVLSVSVQETENNIATYEGV